MIDDLGRHVISYFVLSFFRPNCTKPQNHRVPHDRCHWPQSLWVWGASRGCHARRFRLGNVLQKNPHPSRAPEGRSQRPFWVSSSQGRGQGREGRRLIPGRQLGTREKNLSLTKWHRTEGNNAKDIGERSDLEAVEKLQAALNTWIAPFQSLLSMRISVQIWNQENAGLTKNAWRRNAYSFFRCSLRCFLLIFSFFYSFYFFLKDYLNLLFTFLLLGNAIKYDPKSKPLFYTLLGIASSWGKTVLLSNCSHNLNLGNSIQMISPK